MAETPGTTTKPASDRSRIPLWAVEGLDVLHLRSGVVRTVVAAGCVVGIAVTVIAPDVLPPTPLVGAAVAVAAILLGVAVAVAVDAADLTLRGPRHVRAAGGELVAILPAEGGPEDVEELADAVLDARDGSTRLLLGLAASGIDPYATAAWTDALAVALARRGSSVLSIDVATGGTDRPGLYEVVREGHKLAAAVDFETDIQLARMGAGHDHPGALAALPEFPPQLPRDLDLLLVALPLAASRGSVATARALDHMLVVAERDVTSRVQLIAALDALEAAGTRAQVVLLDTPTARKLASARRPVPAPSAPLPPEEAAKPEAAEAAADATEEGAEGAEVAEVGVSEAAEDVPEPDLSDADEQLPAPAAEADEPAPAEESDGHEPEAPTEPALDEEEVDQTPSADVETPPVTARDVDVVLGAAASAALESTLHEPDATPAAEVEAAAEPATPEDAADAGPADADSTDELPAVRPQPLREAEPEEDELRTTAQLAILLNDIETRSHDS